MIFSLQQRVRKSAVPIVQAFKGTIKVTGKRWKYQSPETMYENSKTSYGETIGELLDNMVESSVRLTNELFEWSVLNLPTDYDLEKDSWYVEMTYPNILDVKMSNPKTHSLDNSNGSSLHSLNAIVRHAVTSWSIHLEYATGDLQRIARSMGESFDELTPSKPLDDSYYELETYREIAQYGFTGTDLDAYLAIAESKGYLKAHEEKQKQLQEAHERARAVRVRIANRKEKEENRLEQKKVQSIKTLETAPATKKWWKK